ncbi:hypothetical protein [Glutamicibacter nicotianae]|uniref:DUF5129 domain-containing protein n=1 Tax=Glutamicibacter nicotianae TaxID=37929 RepID=A0ABQ0RKY4_GLUNI|nr:hypothetical protein [Glutamicibacter nicotianae]GEC12463.1 hypothetical protein ANI01nite_16660 [Glutamicibacter nicotianae]
MPARLMHDSTGRRLRRPFHWTAIAAIFMALVTTALGVRAVLAVQAANVPAPYEVTVVVQGENGFNITQQTVDAELARHPVRATAPLELVIADRWLTGNELLRGEVPENQIIVSTKMDNLDSGQSEAEQRFSGVGVDRNLVASDDAHDDLRFDIENAFIKNISVGHGPKAAVAAAHTAAVLLDDSPSNSAIFWFAVVGASAMLTAALLASALRFRSRWASRHRRLAAAQRKLARVVLDLEALEATYQAADPGHRPAGFTKAWRQLEALSLDAARREDPLVRLVFDRAACLDKKTGQQLAAFEADARTLTELADSLMGAGSVHAHLAGTGSTFDKLSAPINDAATALLIRLETAPGTMVAGKDLEDFRGALGELLNAAHGDTGQRTAVERWADAEKQLAKLAAKISTRLRRYPRGQKQEVPPIGAQHNELRASLGLPPVTKQSALQQIDTANALARGVLGDTLQTDQAAGGTSGEPAGWQRMLARLASTRKAAGDEPPKLRRAWKFGLLAALLVGSLIASGLIVSSIANEPERTYEGSGRGMELEIDDQGQLVDESEIRRYMEEDFETTQRILVAVRDAEAYLDLNEVEGYDFRESTPESVRSAILRIKDEYSDRADPANGELPEDLTIIPLLITDEGKGIMPGLISGAVISGTASWGTTGGWEHGSIYESNYPAMEAAGAAEDFAVVLKRAGYEQPDYNTTLLYWMLVFMLFFTVINVLQVIQYLLGASTQLTRFSRGSRSVQQSRRQLEQLAMGLEDSQINAVAVLGASEAGTADEAGQRLFERALMMAWREAEELSSMTLGQRLQAGYAQRAAHLAQLVALLGERDADVARRAKALVLASRGSGGDAPAEVQLPGR